MSRQAHLDRTAYFDPIVTLSYLEEPLVWMQLAAMLILGVCFRTRLSWRVLALDAPLRGFVLAVAAPVAWYLVTLDFNYLTGQSYELDRLLLLASYVAITFHPLFVPVFLLLAMNFLFQLQVPFPVSFTDKRLVISLLTAFYAFLPASLLLARRKDQAFVFIALAVIGTHYAYPGLHKLVAGWVFYERIEDLFLSAHLHGWLPGLDWNAASEVSRAIARIRPLLVVGTQVLELSGWLLLFHPRWAQAALLGLVGMHAGIAASSGIFFWKWMVVDVAAVGLVQRASPELRERIFGLWPGVAAAAAIACAPLVVSPLKLTWFDTPLNYSYTVEATTDEGAVYEVPRLFFSPYDLPFTQGALWYLEEEPVVTTHFGKVKTPEALAILHAHTLDSRPEALAAALPVLQDLIGEDRRRDDRRKQLVVFLQRFFRNVNEYGRVGAVIPFPKAPNHIYVGAQVSGGFDPRGIRRVRIWREVIYVADRPIGLGRELVLETEIGEGAAATD